MTQEQLAKAAGISRTMITEIENGNANPSVEVAKKIAAVVVTALVVVTVASSPDT
ncbi:MAG: helix-turn-helix transcriptional regulator [Clostridia bacterium]